MKTWKDVAELADKERFSALLTECGSFDRVAKQLGCGRMSVRHAAAAHKVQSPYRVRPKFLFRRG